MTLLPTLSTETARETLVSIIDAYGQDFVYQKHADADSDIKICKYVHPVNSTPDCLIGRMLYALGVTIPQLQYEEGRPACDVVPLFFSIEPELREALQRAQSQQDCGSTWGNALKAFDESRLFSARFTKVLEPAV